MFGKTKYQVIVQDAVTGIDGNMGNNKTRDEAYDWSRNSLEQNWQNGALLMYCTNLYM